MTWIPVRQMAVVLAVIAAAATGGCDSSPTNVSVTVNAQPGDKAPTRTVEVPAAAVEKAAAVEGGENLRDETPAGVPKSVLDAAQAAEERQGAHDQLVEGGASSTQRGCTTRFVRNQSSRNGVRPKGVELHYTVSHNVFDSPVDLNALDARANDPAAGVSWHYAIDRDAGCHANVPEDRKAWHSAAANPFYIGIEIVAFGDEDSYQSEAGFRKLALVVHDAAHRWGFPLQKGAVENCVPTRPGIITHQMTGLCGGGHHDISPFKTDRVIAKVIRYAREADRPANPLSRAERRIAAGARDHRGTGHSCAYWQARADRRIHTLTVRAHTGGWKPHRRGERRHQLARARAGHCR